MSAVSSQYLSIVFFGTHVLSSIWQEINGQITVIAKSSLVNIKDDQTLAQSVDASLEELGDETLNLKQVLFVVPYSWTRKGNLNDESKKILKNLSAELVLEPIGYVIYEDGLITWQEQQYTGSFSGLIVQHQPEKLEATLVINSEIEQTFSIGKSDQSINDIEELLARVEKHKTSFQKIIFFDTSPTDNQYDQMVAILKNRSQKNVELISAQQLAEIVIISGGGEVLGIADNQMLLDYNNHNSQSSPNNNPDNNSGDFRPASFLKSEASNLGESSQKDTISKPPIEESSLNEPKFDPDQDTVINTETRANDQSRKKFSLKLSLPKFSNFNLAAKFKPNFKLGKFSSGKKSKIALLLGAVTILLILGTGSLYWLLKTSYQANIQIAIEPEQLSTTTQLNLTVNQDSPAEAAETIPANEINESITVSREVATTGTKLTGDPAKGEVIIYNKTSEPATFSQGTEISTGDHLFTLDEEVTVASASAREERNSRTIVYGEQTAKVTAAEFGPDGNLPEKQEFSVDDYGSSSFTATNDKAFEGGSSREIQAVAEKDITDTVSSLLEEAKGQLQEILSSKGNQASPVIITDQYKIEDQQTSVAVGQEAKFVNVVLTVSGKAYQLNIDDLIDRAETILADEIPVSYNLIADQLEVGDSKLISSPEESPRLETKISVPAEPQLDINELKNQITSEYISRGQTLLERKPGVKSVSIALSPSWSKFIIQKLPADPVKINIEISK